MTILDRIVGLGFSAVVFIGFPCRLWWDFYHPEDWVPHTGTDPHIYIWGLPLCWLVCIYVFTSIYKMERKRKRRARLAALLVRAEELAREHRRDEAAAVLEECQSLLAQVKST